MSTMLRPKPIFIRTQRYALAIFILALTLYNFPLMYDLAYKPFFAWTAAFDTVSTSLLPFEILQEGDFTLEEYWAFFARWYHDPYFVAQVNGQTVSRYPVTTAVLAIPFYGIPLGTGWLHNPGYAWIDFPRSLFIPAKFAAAFLAATSALMFFFCARVLTNLRHSVVLTIAFAFGTSVWTTASQSLWQQTASILFQLIGIWFLLQGKRKGADAVAPAALFFSAATVSRMNNGITALLFTFYVLVEYRVAFWKWIAWALPPALLTMMYNAVYNGSPFIFGYQEGIWDLMTMPQLEALAGFLTSPSRGLFIYSPFLILGAYGLWLARRDENRRFYFFSAIAFLASILFLSMFPGWHAGWGYGTRLLVDVMPFATLLLIPVLPRLSRRQWFGFGVLIGYAVVLQTFGLWDYGERWHWYWLERGGFDVWDIPNNEPLFYFRQYLEMANNYLSRFLAQ